MKFKGSIIPSLFLAYMSFKLTHEPLSPILAFADSMVGSGWIIGKLEKEDIKPKQPVVKPEVSEKKETSDWMTPSNVKSSKPCVCQLKKHEFYKTLFPELKALSMP
jgi:hypothetical protein